VSEFPFAEIAGAAEGDRTGVTENLPLPLRGLYGVRRTAAVNELSVEQTAVDKIEGQGLEANDFGHLFTRRSEPAFYARISDAASVRNAAAKFRPRQCSAARPASRLRGK
jgi:hypothetical protein